MSGEKHQKKNDFFPAFHFLETEIAFGSTKVAISTGKKLKSRLGNNVKMSDFAPPLHRKIFLLCQFSLGYVALFLRRLQILGS